MRFLKKFVGGKTGGDAGADPLGARFDEEWYRAVRRFAIVTGYGVDGFEFNLPHPETREIMPPHLGIAPYFEDWKQIRTPWDRMDLFFRVILGTQGIENFHVWAAANILTACRQVEQSYEMLQGAELTEAGTQLPNAARVPPRRDRADAGGVCQAGSARGRNALAARGPDQPFAAFQTSRS